jgi:outer membrane protein
MEITDFQHFDIQAESPVLGNLDSVEDVYKSALQNRPEMKSANYKLQSSEKNVSIARADYFPTLTFGAQFGTGYYNLQNMQSRPFDKQLSDNMSTSVGLNLNIPIFNRFDTKNRVETAKLVVENSKLEIENAKKELFKTIQQAHQNALAAKERRQAADKSVTAMREAFRYAEQRFDAGRASQYEVFQAKNNLTQTLSEQMQAKYEYIFRLKILEMYNGDTLYY